MSRFDLRSYAQFAAWPAPRTLLVPVLMLVGGTGCVVGPDYETPATTQPVVYSEAQNRAGFDAATEPEIEWWKGLEDPVLVDLVERARQNNFDLAASEARLQAARALLGLQKWQRWPGGSVSGSVEERDLGEFAAVGGSDGSDTYYSAGLDASWEVDLFGRIRRSIEAQGATYEAAVNDRRAVFVAVSSEVGRTYLEFRGLQSALEVARLTISNEEESLEIVEALQRAGRVTDLDVEQSRERLETTRAFVPDLESAAGRARRRLAVLVGEEPSALDSILTPTRALPPIPDRIAIGDPASLLRRRPDVVAAERRLAAATARIGVATADLFPRLSLNASFSALATSLDDLTNSGAQTTRFGPFLSWPLFDLGRVRRAIAVTEADADALVADYQSTVLRSLEETENALERLDNHRRRQAHRRRALEAAKRALDLAKQRYEAGLTDYLTVLVTEDRHLVAEDAVVRGATEIGTAYVALYEALGGAWQ
ncbi:MAG: efflux transporter outer membrane subunit [Thermoanaerobaculia bacterium]|nr:efflux transporter outer membrane subunit [Thermoanaerobaculia bacterium]